MIRILASVVGLCWLLVALASHADYGYPFDDPYVATVLETPPEYAAKLPKKIAREVRSIRLFPDRKIPEILWYNRKLGYSLVYQDQKAPLIFMIAGTGANYAAQKMQKMERAFYQAGFHVVSLSSPTHPEFITTASRTGVPGRLTDDSRDLYYLMEQIRDDIKDKVDISAFYLTGYSLGATQSAFVAKLDEQQRVFNFEKVLLINPAVNLFNSISIFDAMLVDNLPPQGFPVYFDELTSNFSKVYRDHPDLRFDENFLFAVYKNVDGAPKRENVAALIAVAFRTSLASMVFVSDIMTDYGYIKPEGLELGRTDSLTDYFIVSHHLSFGQYFDDYAFPFFNAREPGLTREAFIKSLGLPSIAGYLREAKKIAVISNEDELILAKGELDFLRHTFGERAKIYPKGGHCGNMNYPDNVKYMVDYFTQ